MSLLCASMKRIGSKTTEKSWKHRFPHYKSMRAFCCHGNQSFDSICPKTLCSLSPTPVMLHIKFEQDWATGFRDIQVWKCGRRQTVDRPLVYYKLTLWAFDSGELKFYTAGVIRVQVFLAINRADYRHSRTYSFPGEWLSFRRFTSNYPDIESCELWKIFVYFQSRLAGCQAVLHTIWILLI